MKLDIRNDHRHLQRLHNIANVISGISDIKVIIDKNAQGPYFLPKHDLIVLPNVTFLTKSSLPYVLVLFVMKLAMDVILIQTLGMMRVRK